MLPARSGSSVGLWSEFQDTFSEFAGLSIQAFSETGSAVHPSPKLPSLCAFFQRYPETQAACQKDCFSKAAACRDARQILPARCYAGLSYRIVPIRRRNRLHSVILVGRVLTEVFGGEQCLGFIERYKLSHDSFLQSLAGLRSLGSPDLDRIAVFVRRLATTSIAGDARLEHRRSLNVRKQGLIDFARHSTAFHDRGVGRTREMLEFLGRLFAAPGAAILLAGDDAGRVEVHSSIGLGEETLHVLANQDWSRIFGVHGRKSRLVLSDRKEMLRAGLDCADVPLVIQRLHHGPHIAGYLVVSGAALSVADLKMLESAAAFVAARMVHLQCRERAEQKDEEARLLGQMAEKCLTAHSVEELLPLALEAAMCSLRARRGSILLAEEKGRITAQALRGDHEPLWGTIEELRPDSISHKVFFNRRSMLVQDTGLEPGVTGAMQYPYASRSFVSVPLRENGHALGVLHLTEREGEEVFTPRDLSLLERLGLQASAAIRKTRLEEEVQELRVSSSIDHLTGVYNRRHLEEQLAIEFERAKRFGQPLAVAMLDIDLFKDVNDAMGHEYGDNVLKIISGTVRRQLRTVDILARYGGDEFVLVLPGTDAQGAMNSVEKIRRVIEDTVFPGDRPPSTGRRCTVSFGLSVYPETSATAEELLRRADQSLLQAKSAGRNTSLLWKTDMISEGSASGLTSTVNT
ncbi:MAG: diguanylate cyclase [Candidatus Methylomirabilia bacterium]